MYIYKPDVLSPEVADAPKLWRRSATRLWREVVIPLIKSKIKETVHNIEALKVRNLLAQGEALC